jgi:hypothetical protein
LRLRLLSARGSRESPHSFRLPKRRDLPTIALYAGATALYVLIGVLETDFLLSWYTGAAYLLVVAWLVPAAVKRIRGLL